MTVPALNTDSIAAWYYRYHRHPLIQQAVTGGGPLVDRLIHRKRWPLESGQVSPLQALFSHLLSVKMLGGEKLDKHALQTDALGDFIPVPRRPQILHTTIHSPQGLIPTLGFLAPLASEFSLVLEQSDLNDKRTPLRTEVNQFGPIVRGCPEPNVFGLMCLSHELGHCLAERRIPPTTLSAQVISEATAWAFEKAVIDWYLKVVLRSPQSDIDAWCAYRTTVSLIDYYYCQLEATWLFPDDSTTHIPFFRRTVDVLRESLFSVPGYQCIYLAAAHLGQSYFSCTGDSQQDNLDMQINSCRNPTVEVVLSDIISCFRTGDAY